MVVSYILLACAMLSSLSVPLQVSEPVSLEKQLQELQAQIAALTMTIASRNGSGIVPSSPAVVEGPVPVVAHGGPGTTGAEAETLTATNSGDPARESAAR
jgi:hypothetical protein